MKETKSKVYVVSAENSTTKTNKPYTKLKLKTVIGDTETECAGFIWDQAVADVFTKDGLVAVIDMKAVSWKPDSFTGGSSAHITDWSVRFESGVSLVPKGKKYDKGEEMLICVKTVIDGFSSNFVKKVAKEVLSKFTDEELIDSPAAKLFHHSFRGGLIEHTFEMMKTGQKLLELEWFGKDLNRDLCLFGIIFHDIGKAREYKITEKEIKKDVYGSLVPHIPLTAAYIHTACTTLGVPREIEAHLMHVVLAHHGKVEWGSPVAPMSPEAIFVHYVDNLHGDVRGAIQALQKESEKNPKPEVAKYIAYTLPTERFSDVLSSLESNEGVSF